MPQVQDKIGITGKVSSMKLTDETCEDKYVCASHFEDQNIKDFITGMCCGEKHVCSYCGEKDAVSLKSVAEHIGKCCRRYYCKFDNTSCPSYSDCKDLPFFVEYNRGAISLDALIPLNNSIIDDLFDLTSEQEKMLMKMRQQQKIKCDTIQIFKNISSLVDELVKLDNVSDAEEMEIKKEIISVLKRHFGNGPLFFKDLMYGEADKELKYDWSQYSKKSIDLGFDASKNDADISRFFNTIIQQDTIFNLLRPIYCREKINRCRKVDDGSFYRTFEDLTAPPAKYVKRGNRMSRANVSMFYGAFEEETAVAEVNNPEAYTVGVFLPKRILTVLDLTDIPDDITMLGDYDCYIMRFLKGFVEDISQKVEEEKEYVPTQLFVDFLRESEDDPHRRVDFKLDGIIYDSAKTERQGTCVVLFCDHDSSADVLKLDYVQKCVDIKMAVTNKN